MIIFGSGLCTNDIVNLKHQGAFQKLMIGWQRHQGVSETPKNADVICEQPLHQYAFWSKYHLMLWFLSNNRVLLKVRCVWSVSYQYHLNYVHLFTSHYPYAHCLVPTIWFLLCRCFHFPILNSILHFSDVRVFWLKTKQSNAEKKYWCWQNSPFMGHDHFKMYESGVLKLANKFRIPKVNKCVQMVAIDLFHHNNFQ